MRTGSFGGCLLLGVLAPAFLACTHAQSRADAGVDGDMDAGITGITTILASGQNDPVEMSLQNGTLYWASFTDPGTIMSVSTAGGSAPAVVQSARNNPYSVATDATTLYWIDYGTYDSSGDYNNDGAVLQASLDGGTPLTLAAGRVGPNDLAVSGAGVYWVDIGEPVTTDVPMSTDTVTNYPNGLVLSVPVAGDTVATLATPVYPYAIAADAQHVYWTTAGSFSSTTGLYNHDGAVIQSDLMGGMVTTLAAGQEFPTAITVDAHDVYFTCSGPPNNMTTGGPFANTGYVAKVPIGGTAVTTLATFQDAPDSIAVDAVHAVWVNGGVNPDDGSVAFIPLDGGMPATIAAGQTNPVGLAVSSDDGHIYWTESGSETDGGVGYNGAVVAFTRQ